MISDYTVMYARMLGIQSSISDFMLWRLIKRHFSYETLLRILQEIYFIKYLSRTVDQLNKKSLSSDVMPIDYDVITGVWLKFNMTNAVGRAMRAFAISLELFQTNQPVFPE